MKTYILFAAAALTLAACTNENDPVAPADGKVAARIVADIDHVATRASDAGFVAEDRIGISCTSTDGMTIYSNIPYSYDDQDKIFSPDGDVIYFQSGDKVSFNAYYPFAGTNGMLEPIAVTTDAEAQKNLPRIDFLFAMGATADKNKPTVLFTGEAAFRHSMSRITIEFKEGSDVVFEDCLTAYTLKGLDLRGTFNPENGVAVAQNNTTPEEGLKMELTGAKAGNDGKYTAPSVIVFPQDVNGTIALEVTVEGETYRATLTLPSAIEGLSGDELKLLNPGYNYKFPVTVKKAGLSVGTCEIAEWKEAPGDPTDATM
ncbi:MAG: fimbrillin family protein [Alistipes sp.]|uniref:fimbrillin family protein n=1 Tax=Alistipes sp. TaxID=1872444 RepID=UPI0025BBD3FE|nr:fimbrillin family protein [Alistipes sp.]MCD8275964.1 fimbrillin family protein [Alistipes sp.]